MKGIQVKYGQTGRERIGWFATVSLKVSVYGLRFTPCTRKSWSDLWLVRERVLVVRGAPEAEARCYRRIQDQLYIHTSIPGDGLCPVFYMSGERSLFANEGPICPLRCPPRFQVLAPQPPLSIFCNFEITVVPLFLYTPIEVQC